MKVSTLNGQNENFTFLWENMLDLDSFSKDIINRAGEKLGDRLRDWQAVAVSRLAKGRDVVIKAGTGSGKSWSYIAMICAKVGGIVLVLTPLKSIMDSQVCSINSHGANPLVGISRVCEYSGMQVNPGELEGRQTSLGEGRPWGISSGICNTRNSSPS